MSTNYINNHIPYK